jgi:hypothetical protein
MIISTSQFTPLVITRLVILASLLGTLASLILNGFSNPVISVFFIAFVFVAFVAEFLPLTAERWIFPKFPVLRFNRPLSLAVAAAPLLWSPPRIAGVLMLAASLATASKSRFTADTHPKLLEAPLEERIYQVL